MRTLVVAPHPDDEILGCGGSLLKRQAQGGTLGWLIVSDITNKEGWNPEKIKQRQVESSKVQSALGIASEHLYQLNFPTTKLDCLPIGEVVTAMAAAFKHFLPEEVFLPYPGDAHTDHKVTFEAASACTKWFRYPSIKKILAYETLSETDFGINPLNSTFRPVIFENIYNFLERKIDLMEIYQSEIAEFPFPRSKIAIKSLARVRGSQAGFKAAEAFLPLRELVE